MTTTVALVVCVWVFVAILIGAGHGANKDPLKSRYISPTPVSLFDDSIAISDGPLIIVLVLGR